MAIMTETEFQNPVAALVKRRLDQIQLSHPAGRLPDDETIQLLAKAKTEIERLQRVAISEGRSKREAERRLSGLIAETREALNRMAAITRRSEKLPQETDNT